MLKQLLFLAGCTLAFCASVGHGYDLAPYKKAQAKRAIKYMLENVSPPGAAPGTIIASPSKLEPDYFRHWVRDGALVANVIVSLWEHAKTDGDRLRYEQMLWDYVLRSSQHQKLIYHPIFGPDGNPINEDWGRPQNDGPALRAIVLQRFAHILKNRGRQGEARERLYSIINEDLNGILYFGDYGFDIWEEVRGFHFYTRMVFRKALIMGEYFARMEGDEVLAKKCKDKVGELEASINEHWDETLGYIVASRGIDGGMMSKTIHLDSQAILGVLHGEMGDDSFATYDFRVLKTVMALENLFTRIYPINENCNGIPLIGRFEQCNWDGYTRGKLGNPWLLTTEGFGEFYDRLARDLERRGYIEFNENTRGFYLSVTPSLITHSFPTNRIERNEPAFRTILVALHAKADGYYKRVLEQQGEEPEFFEQFHRVSGAPSGPHRLGWSCVAAIVGKLVREDRVLHSQFN